MKDAEKTLNSYQNSFNLSGFQKLPSYAYFVESLLRTITIALPLEDTRKLSTALTALVNEKQKQVTAAMQTGGKKKKNKPMGAKMGTKSTNNNDPYSDMQGGDLYEGEYDDFM